jgi:chromosome segregation ATPase
MFDIKLTLTNYRCFTREQPMSIQIGKGFTALVGPNNTSEHQKERRSISAV